MNHSSLKKSFKNQTLYDGFKTDPMNFFYIFWLYFFEYCVIISFFDRITQLRDAESSDYWPEKNMFTISQFIYQAGVLVSRSSLYCFKLKITGIITIILFAHFLAFFILCLWYQNVSIWIVFSLSLSVGIFGGWGYLFAFYRLMDNNLINDKNKEILINLLSITSI